MTTPSHVQSIDDLKRLFAATLELDQNYRNQATALRQAAEQLRRWVTTEARQYWNNQLMRAERQLQSDYEELHRSKITDPQRNGAGSTDAMIRVMKSKKRLELCMQRQDAVKQWTREIDRLVDNFIGRISAFTEVAEQGLPSAIEDLKAWIIALEAYSESMES